MSYLYLHHIRACNSHDLSGFLPFHVGPDRVGWVRHELAQRLTRFNDVFTVEPERISLLAGLGDFESRSDAMARVLDALVADGTVSQLRDEDYPVLTSWGQPPLLKIDRAAVALFGIKSFGLHVNGFVRRADGIHLWVGKRATDREIAPGKLDNLVAGGQPIGLTLDENLVKEAHEEAGLSAEAARRAVPVGVVSYLMESPAGLKPDTLFLYDLEVGEDFVPRNTDGEVEHFMLWPLDEVARRVRDTEDFKFNVSLVIIDFLMRHGYLKPEDAEYPDIAIGLRRAV
jgi:8-oxo-dGTP pyrophosphatase MutT (NUDIX family)